jgi:tRNA(Ile2) C34 agmatinyltransferase TiaS
MSKEQISFNFEEQSPEPAEKVESHERDECPACGNVIESDSPGCFQCRGNKDKLSYQKKQKSEK